MRDSMMQVPRLLRGPLPRRLRGGVLLVQSRDFGDARPQRRRSVSSEGPGLDGKPQVHCLRTLPVPALRVPAERRQVWRQAPVLLRLTG